MLAEDYVILEGMCPNPYPYIANADLLVSESISESFGLSIYEALLLGTLVVGLYFDAINELIDGSNGIVVNTFDEMTECIKNLASFSQNYQQLRERTHLLLDYNEIGKEQFEEMLNKLQ